MIGGGQDYKVVIEAHSDEISWFVNYISDDGYIHVRRNGGSDAAIAPSMRVNLHTAKGVVKGVFGWPAIHVRDIAKDQVPKVHELFIDVGAAKKDEVLEMGIHVGTVATFADGLDELNDKYYLGRALDNRMGGFMIAEVARMLHENNVQLPFTLVCGECSSGRNRFARSRNDFTPVETGSGDLYGCDARYAVADV